MGGLKCQIKRDKVTGKAIVTNPDGSFSTLFDQLLQTTKDENTALTLWATIYSQSFEDVTGKTAQTATLDDVTAYALHNSSEELSESELSQLKMFAKKNNVESLTELFSTLNNIFLQGNNRRSKAIASGLFTADEYDNLDLPSVIHTIKKLSGSLSKGETFNVAADRNTYFAKDTTAPKTILGTYPIISEAEIDNLIFRNISSVDQIPNAIQSLPFSDFVDRYNEDTAFRNQVNKRFENLKAIPVPVFVDGKLSYDTPTEYTTIKNTLLADVSSLSIEAELDYLNSITDYLWYSQKDAVTEMLSEIEDDLLDVNLDVIGLKKLAENKEAVIKVLTALQQMIESPSDANILNFVTVKNDVVGREQRTAVVFQNVHPSLKDKTILQLNTDKSKDELFEQERLIKVSSNNLYHQVQEYSKADLYNYLYNRITNNSFVIPADFKTYETVDNKQDVLNDLERYVNSFETGYNKANSELVALYQLAFNHPKFAEKSAIKQSPVQTNPNYLKTGFVTDFYSYMLNEKKQNSEIWNTTLSKFTIEDNDIVLLEQLDSIEGIEYEQELKDYIRSKKDTTMDHLLTNEEYFPNEDIIALNHPEKYSEFTNKIYRLNDTYFVTKTTSNEWVKVNGIMYRKVGTKDNTDIFAAVKSNPNNVYFSLGDNFAIDTQEVQALLNRNLLTSPATAMPTQQEVKEAIQASASLIKTPQTQSTAYALTSYLKNNLGLDISVLTEGQMKDELAKRGYDSVEARNVSYRGELDDNTRKQLSFEQTEDTYKENQIQFLKEGETVYGFYDKTQQKMYLTQEYMNTNTLIHESWHMYKPAVQLAAENGDMSAQLLLDKMDQLATDLFNEEEFNKRFDSFLGSEQAQQLTKQDILDRVTTSILKGEFNNSANVQNFLDFKIKTLSLSEEEVEFVNNELNACG